MSNPPVVRQPLVVGTRDASWYDRPDVRSVKRWHIATDQDTAACCPGPQFVRGSVMPLDDGGYVYDPERIFDDARCRRSGCQVHWKTVPPRPRHQGGGDSRG